VSITAGDGKGSVYALDELRRVDVGGAGFRPSVHLDGARFQPNALVAFELLARP